MSAFGAVLRDGLGLALLRAPRRILPQVGIGMVLALVLLDELLALPRLWVITEAPRTVSTLGLGGVMFWLAMWLLAGAALARLSQRPLLASTAAAWLAAAGLLPTLIDSMLSLSPLGGDHGTVRWAIHALWLCAITLRLALFLAPNFGRALAAAVVAAVITLLPGLVVQPPELIETDWEAHYEARFAEDGENYVDDRIPGELDDPETTIYAQPDLLDLALRRLAPQRPGQIDLFLLGFAGDASEGAFRNEVDFLPELARSRFDAEGRSLRLINHPGSAADLPLATVTNLERALTGIAQRMDPEEDILFLYLSSHGSDEPELYVNQPPLPLDQLDPLRLRDALDDAGIGWRVIVISACYSGGFIDTLRSPNTLVITAARADRTSFGCGNSANATWFGQAFLIDGLNHTASFRRAFLRARAQIAEQEKTEDVDPSEPQWLAGEAIGSQLAKWLEQLPPGTPATFVPSVQVIADPPASASEAGHRP